MKPKKRPDGTWQINYRDGEKSRSRYFPAGSEGRRLASQFAAEVALKKSKKETLPLAPREGIYLDELTQMWTDEKKVQGRKVRWLAEWAAAFNKHFLEPLCTKPAHKITQSDVMAVIAANYAQCKQATRNRYIGYLKATFTYGVDHGHLEANPLAKWKHGKEGRRTSRLTLDDLKAIYAHAPDYLAWAIEVAWHIPARPGLDLFSLRYDAHVRYERGGVEINHSKVGRRAFALCDKDFMQELLLHESMSKSGYLIEFKGRQVKRIEGGLCLAAKRAGLPYTLCMYDIRHLWITTMMDKGIEPSVIAYLAGTSVEMILDNYYEPHATERVRVAEVLPGISAKPTAELDRKVVGIAEGHRIAKL